MYQRIYDSIKNEYDKRQKAAFDNLVLRKNEIYLKIPRIKEIDDRIHHSGITLSRRILTGEASHSSILAHLDSEITSLKEEKKQLLASAGYPENYLEMAYSCEKCRDTGYYEDSSMPAKCSCFKQQLINHLYRESTLNLAGDENFSSFDDTLYPVSPDEKKYGIRLSPREYMLEIKAKCLGFVSNFSSPDEKNLFFSGPTGVGKTFLSKCIAVELMNMGRTVMYQTAPVLFNIISENRVKAFKEDGYTDTKYKNIIDVELLIIDDLGTESGSSSRYAELLTILNAREANNRSRPCKTIVSSNIGAKELYEYYDERVASRIIGCFSLYRFIGEDIRRIKRLGR